MTRIRKAAILAEINQPDRHGQPRIFSLEYAKADGSLGTKERARKAGALGGTATHSSGKFGYNVKHNGILMIVDCKTNETRSIKISRLIKYNGVRIQHG
jgi:hypothetical protein